MNRLEKFHPLVHEDGSKKTSTSRGGNSQIVPPTKVTLSLDSHPVSLLWAHQLRREHQLLLDKIESIAADTEQHEPRTSELATKAAKSAVDHIEKPDKAMQQSFEELKENLQKQNERLSVLEGRLHSHDAKGSDLNSVQQTLTALEERMRTHVTDIQNVVDGLASKDALLALETKISDIDKELIGLLTRDDILVPDSMKGYETLSKDDGMPMRPWKDSTNLDYYRQCIHDTRSGRGTERIHWAEIHRPIPKPCSVRGRDRSR